MHGAPLPESWDSQKGKKKLCLFCILGYSKHIIFFWKIPIFLGEKGWDWGHPPPYRDKSQKNPNSDQKNFLTGFPYQRWSQSKHQSGAKTGLHISFLVWARIKWNQGTVVDHPTQQKRHSRVSARHSLHWMSELTPQKGFYSKEMYFLKTRVFNIHSTITDWRYVKEKHVL